MSGCGSMHEQASEIERLNHERGMLAVENVAAKQEIKRLRAELDALKAAQSEPVAWTTKGQIASMENGMNHYIQGRVPRFVQPTENDVPLYTHPQPADAETLRDAERYRWLRDQWWCEEEATFRLDLGETDFSNVYQARLNAAIDAAMKKKGA